jgi:transposase-like protein
LRAVTNVLTVAIVASLVRLIHGAPTRAAAEAAIDVFAGKYDPKYEKAVACLTKDREALLAFFDFPAEHWDHLRTSNPIESVFATVRHRTVRTKGALSAKTENRQTRRRRRENMAAIEVYCGPVLRHPAGLIQAANFRLAIAF